jgi:membrane protein implicated in regulation of membrane protease activity
MQDDIVVDNKMSASEAEGLMHRVMWRQARLSLSVAAVFIAILIFIPLFNLLAPSVAATSVAGFPLTWLLLGVMFYPITWILSAFFVKRSDALESEISKEEAK